MTTKPILDVWVELKSFADWFFFEFQDAVLGVDKDRGNNAQPKKSYVPPHLRGKQGGGGDGERPPPDANGPRRDFNDRGGGRG